MGALRLITEGHLGGYVAGGDPATYLPDLWDWLVDDLGVKSVIDIGCGDGVALDHFVERGCKGLGIEGIPQENSNIVQHDYSLGPFVPKRKFDLAWCCEFVEHVEEKFARNFLKTFESAKIVLMTHADKDQPGHHHVNCQSAQYWVTSMMTIGFEFDPELTIATRQQSMKNNFLWIDAQTYAVNTNHYLRSGLAFRKS